MLRCTPLPTALLQAAGLYLGTSPRPTVLMTLPKHLPECEHRSRWIRDEHSAMYYQLDLGYRCAPGCPARAALFDPLANAKAALSTTRRERGAPSFPHLPI